MKKNNYICAILTDFGNKDHYVSSMKGVLLTINPHIKIIDITHEINPQNIIQSSFFLSQVWDYFPENTIFLCVIDPGVGTERKRIIGKIGNRYFVGPDNGIISILMENKKNVPKSFYYIENKKYFLSNISKTFEGRDIFAPSAGYLSLGEKLENFGRKCINPIVKNYLDYERKNNILIAKILNIDIFGNVITNIPCNIIKNVKKIEIEVRKYKKTLKVVKTFGEVKTGEILSYIGSSNFLEFGINCGNFAEKFDISIGNTIKIILL